MIPCQKCLSLSVRRMVTEEQMCINAQEQEQKLCHKPEEVMHDTYVTYFMLQSLCMLNVELLCPLLGNNE